jgi:hypothetical protein
MVHLLATAILLSVISAPSAAASSFRDVGPDDAAAAAITLLTDRQYASGYPDRTYRPDQPITRAEFVKLEILSGGAPRDVVAEACTYAVWFRDLEDAGSLKEYVCHAFVAGIAYGYSDGTFRPGRPISRGEAARLVATAHMLCYVGASAPYTDIENSSFEPFIAQLYAMDWFRPPGERFTPEMPLTRREAAHMLARTLDRSRNAVGACAGDALTG